ncbi:hypothetical protein B0T13DRAFT_488072 [Neurospora crassa]|nr:hypothetical protein B0T13DRAFT_488072 [Neurospora crassa]
MDTSSSQRPDGFTRPNGRSDFEVAIICALAREFDAVCLLIDEFWNEYGDQFEKVQGDHNIYTTGRLETCNVVIGPLSDMGKAMAASAATSLRFSYPRVSLALLVGVCGAVPLIKSGPGMTMTSLGDVIISNIVVQYDLGRVLTDRFARKDAAHNNLGRPNKTIRNILVNLGGSRVQEQIEQRAGIFLKHLQGKANTKASRNRRRSQAKYHGCVICEGCLSDANPACGASLKLSCEELGCDGVCDYADSQKNKGWQNYAAATAASVAKAVIERYITPAMVSDSMQSSDSDLGGRQDTQLGGGGTGGGAGGTQFNGSISGSKFVVDFGGYCLGAIRLLDMFERRCVIEFERARGGRKEETPLFSVKVGDCGIMVVGGPERD